MDSRDILKANESTRRLVQDPDYYKYIFKKTEKIVSVVFYIANNLESHSKYETHVSDILSAAKHVHDTILVSLETRAHVAEDVIRDSAHALIALDSKLRVSQVAGIIAPEAMHVLANEIDAVLRGMNKYLKNAGAFDDMDYTVTPAVESAKPRPRALPKREPAADTASVQSTGLDRKERIKTILEATGEATIKDISDVITDCSEKTIQRELNAMIEDNIVKRHGERRWSKYSLF